MKYLSLIVAFIIMVSLFAQANSQITASTNDYCLKIPVLLYHHIKPYQLARKDKQIKQTVDIWYFEEQLKYLKKKGYQTISAETLADALIYKRPLTGKQIVITLDDGYDDAYKYAYPLARKYKVIINLMVPTGKVGKPGFVSWSNLQEMSKSDYVYIYDHTKNHLSLPQKNDRVIEEEIMTAKEELERRLGKLINIFAYPYGSANSKIVSFLKKHKFKASFSTKHGFWQCSSFIYNLHRNHIENRLLSNYGL